MKKIYFELVRSISITGALVSVFFGYVWLALALLAVWLVAAVSEIKNIKC